MSIMLVGRHLLQQLEQMGEAHEKLIRALVSRKMVVALRRVSDSQAGRDIERYQKEAVELRNSSVKQRKCIPKHQHEGLVRFSNKT